MEEGYGPMSLEVELLIAMADNLSAAQASRIADAYRQAGCPHAMFAHVAAKGAGRQVSASIAARDMRTSVTMYAILHDFHPRDVEPTVWAATNAAYAMATEDLIGTLGYSSTEYGRLMDPWFAGFADDREKEREK
jgi:hypothetical protein